VGRIATNDPARGADAGNFCCFNVVASVVQLNVFQIRKYMQLPLTQPTRGLRRPSRGHHSYRSVGPSYARSRLRRLTHIIHVQRPAGVLVAARAHQNSQTGMPCTTPRGSVHYLTHTRLVTIAWGKHHLIEKCSLKSCPQCQGMKALDDDR